MILTPSYTFADDDKFQAIMELLNEPNAFFFKKSKPDVEPLTAKITTLVF